MLMTMHKSSKLFHDEDVQREGGVAGAAVAFIKRSRAVANPNPGFRAVLLAREVELLGETGEVLV